MILLTGVVVVEEGSGALTVELPDGTKAIVHNAVSEEPQGIYCQSTFIIVRMYGKKFVWFSFADYASKHTIHNFSFVISNTSFHFPYIEKSHSSHSHSSSTPLPQKYVHDCLFSHFSDYFSMNFCFSVTLLS